MPPAMSADAIPFRLTPSAAMRKILRMMSASFSSTSKVLRSGVKRNPYGAAPATTSPERARCILPRRVSRAISARCSSPSRSITPSAIRLPVSSRATRLTPRRFTSRSNPRPPVVEVPKKSVALSREHQIHRPGLGEFSDLE